MPAGTDTYGRHVDRTDATDPQLHSFLFADISGYSALTELEGDEAAADLAISFGSEVARMARDHGAEMVRQIGDAVMVHCPSAADAVELGLRLQTELQGFPPIHAGIHTGPAVQRADDWWGATVNIAARVMAAAKADQLLVTEATTNAAGDTSRLPLEALSVLRLKNISAPVWVYSSSRAERLAMPAGVLQAA